MFYKECITEITFKGSQLSAISIVNNQFQFIYESD
jgi:hypothetical protein